MRSAQYTHQATTATTDGPATSTARRHDHHTAITSATASTTPLGRTSAAPTATSPAARSWCSSTSTNAHTDAARKIADGYVIENTNDAGNRASDHTDEGRDPRPAVARRQPVHPGQRDQEHELVEHEDGGFVVGDLAERADQPREQREEGPLRERDVDRAVAVAGDVEVERAVPPGGDLIEARAACRVVDGREQHHDRDAPATAATVRPRRSTAGARRTPGAARSRSATATATP